MLYLKSSVSKSSAAQARSSPLKPPGIELPSVSSPLKPPGIDFPSVSTDWFQKLYILPELSNACNAMQRNAMHALHALPALPALHAFDNSTDKYSF